MDWFERLTGFSEESPQQVRHNLVFEDKMMRSLVNHKTFTAGKLETPSLGELRQRIKSVVDQTGKLSLREVVADVQSLHTDSANAGALFFGIRNIERRKEIPVWCNFATIAIATIEKLKP